MAESTQPPAHIPNVHQYLDPQPSYDPSPNEFTVGNSGRSEVASTREILVQEMPYLEGADFDVVKPDPYHEVDGTTFTRTASTNEPSGIPEQSVHFVDDIPRSPPHEPDLTMPEIVNLEESGLMISERIRKPN